jgi:signal peptidase II
VRRRGAALTSAIGLAIVVVDQVSKAAVRARLSPPGTSVPVLGDALQLTYVQNLGASFGMMPGYRPLFVAVSVGVLVAIAAFVIRRRPERRWVVVALGLVAGGALGNLIDRMVFGWVTDFIRIPFDFPVFNVADSCVVVGVGMLIWWLLFGPAPSSPVPSAVPAIADGPGLPSDAAPAQGPGVGEAEASRED